VATTKHTVEYTAALISLCILVNAVNVVLLNALIRLNLFTTGVLLTIKLASDGLSTMGLKKANLIIGKLFIDFVLCSWKGKPWFFNDFRV
jgi:hypothetical protein